ncbi:hypothetical protein ACFCVY_00770 [Streptomyces sp. NPDC056411]|uniref:hypothetical protein n=1 Tax=Streptomyces sp. NPDC056411 TaxID=3345813 RepID=UPI0035D7204F
MIGGRLAGMLAVTAPLGHVETVTVVARDRYPAGRAFPKGVPRARHFAHRRRPGLPGRVLPPPAPARLLAPRVLLCTLLLPRRPGLPDPPTTVEAP